MRPSIALLLAARPHALLLALAVLCGGCVSTSGKHFWSPKTWFSSAPAKTVTKIETTENYQKQILILDAQGEVEKTRRVLKLAPDSRAVSVAIRTAGNASALLVQANGPLAFDVLADFDKWAESILSDTSAISAVAEAKQKSDERKYNADSNELRETREKLKEAESKLLVAFAKENGLADTLRNERALRFWILGGGTLMLLIAGGGWLYLQIATGGIPKAIGSMLKGLDETDPDKANLVRSLLDPVTNRIEQALIRKHT
jgi:hypothetical protein